MSKPCQNKKCNYYDNIKGNENCLVIFHGAFEVCKDYKPEPDKPKLTHNQILNSWIWNKNEHRAFVITDYKPNSEYPYLKGQQGYNKQYFENHCELYTNQDQDNGI